MKTFIGCAHCILQNFFAAEDDSILGHIRIDDPHVPLVVLAADMLAPLIDGIRARNVCGAADRSVVDYGSVDD
ncbi:hypothetical protein D3C74_413670 [compost metagenome]